MPVNVLLKLEVDCFVYHRKNKKNDMLDLPIPSIFFWNEMYT